MKKIDVKTFDKLAKETMKKKNRDYLTINEALKIKDKSTLNDA